ncbi:hypothetical protein [Sulfitobacter sp. JB4-11]|uniref:hypothetical protein n=1 Tax=Sulfitobacter rhodophyticola TaxID=3238304 RepID=UPI003511A9B0
MNTAAPFTEADATAALPVRMLDGGRWLVRGMQRLVGVALILAALGLWLAPGSGFGTDAVLFKLLLSIIAAFAAIGFLQSGASKAAPFVEIDTIRREVRLMRASGQDAAQVIERCAIDDLAHAELVGAHVRLWDASGAFLAEATLTDPQAFARMRACLQDSGKLA